MGVYIRPDSPFYQLLLERPGEKPIRRPTKIPHTASTPQQTKEHKRLATLTYNAAMAALARGDLGIEPHTGPKLAAFWQKRYLPWLRKDYPNAVKETTRVIEKLFLPTMGDLTLDQLHKGRIHAWLAGRTSVTPQSRHRELSHLRGLLSRAVEWHVLTEHPLADLELDAAPTREIIRYLTADEETRLLAALAARDEAERAARERANRHRSQRKKPLYPPLGRFMDALHPIVVLSLNTGMRRGEVFQAEWPAIDWQASVITVEWWTIKRSRKRAMKSRRIPLNGAAMEALRAWHEQQQRPKHGLIFPGAKGQRLTNLQSSWDAVLVDADIEGFRWHDLRHTFASKLVHRGVPLYVVQKLLGHASQKMTERYAHLAPDQGRAAVDLLTGA